MTSSTRQHGKVTFLLIGGQKCGSGWLHRALVSHPDIGGPTGASEKEVNFFSDHYQFGTAWYEERFEPRPHNGDFSVCYLPDTDAPRRAAAYDPDLRLVAVLRDPVDRARSQHRHEVASGRLDPALWRFADAVGQNPSYVDQGRYALHLRRWLEHFGRTQLLVLRYDDLVAEPATLVGACLRHLGLDPATPLALPTERPNRPELARSETLRRILLRGRRAVKERMGNEALASLRSTGLPALARRLNTTPVSDALAPDDLAVPAEIVEELRADAEQLADLVGLDITPWRFAPLPTRPQPPDAPDR